MLEKKNCKRLFAALLCVSMVASISGCGISNAEKPAEDAGGDSAVPVESSSEAPNVKPGAKGTLEFWTVFTGADGTSMQSMVDAYNATNPDYTVNHRAMEANDLYLKLPLAIQSGQDIPDLAINHVERLNDHQARGMLTDLTPYLDKAGIKKENYNPAVWVASDLAGGHYAVPLDSTHYVTFVNMDLYNQYGCKSLDDNILTWDEVKADSALAVADGKMGFALGWFRADWLSSYGQLSGSMSTDGQNPTFDDDVSRKIMNTWIDLNQSGAMQKDGDVPWDLFKGGSVLYITNGTWMLNDVKTSGINAKVVEYPVYDTNQMGHWTSSHNMVIPKDDKRSEEKVNAALAFVDFIGNNSLGWAKAGQILAHNSIQANEEFKTLPQAFITEEDSSVQKVYTYRYYGYCVESLDKVFNEVVFGRMDIDSALKQATQETKDRISTEG